MPSHFSFCSVIVHTPTFLALFLSLIHHGHFRPLFSAPWLSSFRSLSRVFSIHVFPCSFSHLGHFRGTCNPEQALLSFSSLAHSLCCRACFWSLKAVSSTEIGWHLLQRFHVLLSIYYQYLLIEPIYCTSVDHRFSTSLPSLKETFVNQMTDKTCTAEGALAER